MSKQKGFIGLIVLVVLALILLKYFLNFSVFEAADSDQGQQTLGYAGELFRRIWQVIASPVIFIWDEILWPLLKLLWETFQAFITWSHSNLSTPSQ